MNGLENDLERILNIEKEISSNKTNNKSKYDSLLEHILLLSKDYWIPSNDNIKDIKNIKSNSWYSINEYESNNKYPIFDSKINIETSKKMIKCEKIKIYPNKKQRKILIIWMDAYIRMYNETIKFIKKRKINKLSTIVDWKRMRTDHLKSIKKQIINQTNFRHKKKCKHRKNKNHRKQCKHLKYKTQVNSHILDSAIQDACAKLKSCLTNLKRGNIKHFRLRYLKRSKDTKILKIEKNFIDKNRNTFCSSVFVDSFILKRKEGTKFVEFKLNEINKDFTIHYNCKTKEFTLLNPIETKQERVHKNKNTISLDPGLCKFLSGYSTNKCVTIGKELIPKIIGYLKKIDIINRNTKLCSKKLRKVEKRYYKKIENLINDMHWKVIKYLTTNFGNILIGNLSTKNIVQNNSRNNLNGYIKRISLLMKLYQFKQRLIFKCKQRKIGYAEIDEAYTSKTCTKCGYLNNNLGKSRTYKCDFCGLIIDRDFGGARSIFLNSISV